MFFPQVSKSKWLSNWCYKQLKRNSSHEAPSVCDPTLAGLKYRVGVLEVSDIKFNGSMLQHHESEQDRHWFRNLFKQ